MSNPWHYALNQFLNATVENFKKAMRLSQYHNGVLTGKQATADPDDVLMYIRYNPVHMQYVQLYNDWRIAGGQQQGQTLNVDQLLALSKGKLDIWDPQIQVVHTKTTPQYQAIFPYGRNPFYKGVIDTRIDAFNYLQGALTNPALATTKAQVLAHYNTLIVARDGQSIAKATSSSNSGLLELKRVELMELQYANTGVLINKYYKTPHLMEQYFDLNVLRRSTQAFFTGTLAPGEVEPVLIHTFLADDVMHVEAAPEAGFRLFLGQTAGEQNLNGISINAGQVRDITISEFNAPDLSTYRYLTAVNTASVETTYEIELV